MAWFYNLNVFKKLMLSFSLIGILIIGLSVFSLYQLNKVNNASTEIITNWLPSIKVIDSMKLSLARIRSSESSHLLTDDDELNIKLDEANQKIELLKKQQTEYEKLISEPEEKTIYAKVKPQLETFLNDYDSFVVLVKEGKKEEARVLLAKKYLPKYIMLLKEFDELSEINEKGSKTADNNANEIYNSSFYWIISVSITSMLSIVGLAVFISRIISSPLKEAVEFSNNIANGNLIQTMKSAHKDETGQLMNALQIMNDNLKNIVTEVRTGVESIATASSEISSGNMDLSRRTEDQASSLEETASAMEEISSTVKNNTDNIQQVRQMSQDTSKLAAESGVVVNNLVSTMNEISQSSNKIVDIIAVIDNIAFQTNLLALNAAVEAARAGEQGRGFAVVASEVRNLSRKSAEAAKEIKTLIHTSVEKVQTGFTMAKKAGDSMKEVVDSISNVTTIVGEIATSSKEQANGIVEINKAISQMDQVTQQNAALVEEATAASYSLKEQANKLSKVVSVFKLER